MALVSLKHLLAFCVLGTVKAGTSTETAEAVLTPPSWPLASWMDGNLHEVQGRQDVNGRKKIKRVAKTGREIHC